ncbi:hypothetical protein B0H12DRAFT_744851 [Mycena haematopus]|nr:hypothetical protein B0H12DRAFT_744851 [Mycena haematopus]
MLNPLTLATTPVTRTSTQTLHDNHRVSVFIKLSSISAANICPRPDLSTSGDIIIIDLVFGSTKVALINLYNDSVTRAGVGYLGYALDRLDPAANILLVLDSNSHHPHWDRFTKTKVREEDFELYDLTVSRNLLLLTPPDVPTHTSGNVIDLGFCSASIYMAVDAVVDPDFCVGSDHLPIRYSMDFSVRRTISTKFNASKMDLDAFNACLSSKLGARPTPTISSLEELNAAVDFVNTVLLEALETSTPRRRPSSIAKRWWSDSLTRLSKAMRKARRYYQQVRVPSAKESWLTSRRDFYHSISQAKLEV